MAKAYKHKSTLDETFLFKIIRGEMTLTLVRDFFGDLIVFFKLLDNFMTGKKADMSNIKNMHDC